MGRELKRKQAKMQGEKIKKEEIKKSDNPYDDIHKLLKTFIIILLIVLAIHFFTALVITKEIEWFSKDDNSEQVTTVANSILAKNTFMQKDEEYYVYFYDFDEENTDVTYLVNGMLSDSKVYKVNTSDAFNSNYVTDEEVGNSDADSIDNLKVITPTLIKISNSEIIEYYETADVITNYLENK